MNYPVKCVICKSVLATNEDQFNAYPVELVRSDNMKGYICESCKEGLYWCSECEDYDTELVPCRGEIVCTSCKRSFDKQQTERREAASLLRRMI